MTCVRTLIAAIKNTLEGRLAVILVELDLVGAAFVKIGKHEQLTAAAGAILVVPDLPVAVWIGRDCRKVCSTVVRAELVASTDERVLLDAELLVDIARGS